MKGRFGQLRRHWAGASFGERVLAITAAGFLLRLLWALLVPGEPVSDGVVYWRTTQNLVDHGVYALEPGVPFGYWPPGTSFLYATAAAVFGHGMAAFKLVNLVTGTLAMPIYAYLGRRWFSAPVGLMTGAAIALWPTLIVASSVVASEVHFITLLGAGLLAFRPEDRRWPLHLALAGALFALASFVRPTALLAPLIIAGCALIRRPGAWQLVLRGTALLIAVMAVCIAPWTMRNAEVLGAPVLVSTNGAPNFWMGNNPESTGGYMPLPPKVEGMSEVERAKILKDDAVAFVAEEPLAAAGLFVRKLVDTHVRETWAVVWNAKGIETRFGGPAVPLLKGIASLYWLGFLGLALGGAAMLVTEAFRQGAHFAVLQTLANPAAVFWAYSVLVHAVIVGGDRYHMASAPFVALMGSYAAMAALRRFGPYAASSTKAA